jgi:hypothetical protein
LPCFVDSKRSVEFSPQFHLQFLNFHQIFIMQAFAALLLVAAVTGQLTTGVDRNVFDYIKYRQMYPQGQNLVDTMTTGVKIPTIYNYIQQQQQQLVGQQQTGVYGDLVNKIVPTTTTFMPSTQQFNIPSDVTVYTYTLRQLYTLPLFQEYLTLPLFRQFINTPAFQLYLTTGDFQKFMTQPIFKSFFVEPTLFYKYVYPVVQQYQVQLINAGVVSGTQQGKFVVDPTLVSDVNTIVPESIYNYNTKYVQDVFGRRVNTNQMYNNLFTTYKNNNWMTPSIYNKNFMIPQVYNDEVKYDVLNKYESLYPQNLFNKQTILDVLTGDKVFPTVYGQKTLLPFNTNTVVKTQELYLEKIIKDLIEGKITLDDIKTNTLINNKINKINVESTKTIVDPITGEIKIVDEKIMKPLVETVMEQEMNKEAIKKVLLNKNIFNKL